ncbi:MAG: hypothetical protein M3T49_05450, partial [Candidatus Eremiobacteraeota bacterium]|nr:hypothetical protein [Candidatus Eremiobacteraeota bacterium]
MQDTLVRVVLPEMGESVSEGTVTAWRKQLGDWVDAGEPLVDVTTDKVDVEVPSPAGGRLTNIHAADGATISVGAALGDIDTATTREPTYAARSPDGQAQALGAG